MSGRNRTGPHRVELNGPRRVPVTTLTQARPLAPPRGAANEHASKPAQVLACQGMLMSHTRPSRHPVGVMTDTSAPKFKPTDCLLWPSILIRPVSPGTKVRAGWLVVLHPLQPRQQGGRRNHAHRCVPQSQCLSHAHTEVQAVVEEKEEE